MRGNQQDVIERERFPHHTHGDNSLRAKADYTRTRFGPAAHACAGRGSARAALAGFDRGVILDYLASLMNHAEVGHVA
jgi:hypothetical protein